MEITGNPRGRTKIDQIDLMYLQGLVNVKHTGGNWLSELRTFSWSVKFYWLTQYERLLSFQFMLILSSPSLASCSKAAEGRWAPAVIPAGPSNFRDMWGDPLCDFPCK